MAKQPSVLDILEAIQVERNHKIYSVNDWNNGYHKLIVQLAEQLCKKANEDIEKYHEKHPDLW
jgi:hypothetical protein